LGRSKCYCRAGSLCARSSSKAARNSGKEICEGQPRVWPKDIRTQRDALVTHPLRQLLEEVLDVDEPHLAF